jgi:hypothetical protein
VQANTEIAVLAGSGRDSLKKRSVRLVSGRIRTSLKDNLLDGLFSVETPNATCKNMSGRADFSLLMDGENEILEVKVITGALRMEGPQYTIAALRAANTVNVLTTPNRALSHLTGVSGDYRITLDNETDSPVIYDMSPKAVVKIWRTVPEVGGNLVVSTLAVSPTGKARYRFAYVVGRGDMFKAGNDLLADQIRAEQDLDLMPILIPTERKPATAPKAKQDNLFDEDEGQ